MAAILLEFDSDELAVLSTEGLWGSFRSALEDVETIATARIYLPEGHTMQLRLQGMLHRSLVKLENRQTSGSPMLCVDQMRLFTLFDSFKSLPQAKEQIKSMLQRQSDIPRSPDEPRSTVAQEAPGCRDPQAHRGLLKTWMELDTDNDDNKAVEEAIRTAFLSHSRPRKQAIAASRGQEENPLLVPSDDERQQHLRPFSFEVETIKVGDEAFGDAMVTLSHKPAQKILRLHVQEQLPGEGDSKLDIEATRPYNLKYSTSKKLIALGRIGDEEKHVLDIHLRSTREGEILIERFKLLRVIDCPHTLNDVQARKTLTLKRNVEAAGKDRVTPAKKRKPYSTASRRAS
ncbi:MAG: hypothetical protein Q9208_008293 [Pyrenodesmia sp. 3 TL-2023]